MKTITVQADIPPNRELRVVLPDDVPTGPQTITLTIGLAPRSPLDLPVHDLGPWPADLSLHRADWYGDDGR